MRADQAQPAIEPTRRLRAAVEAAPEPPPAYDSWELEERLRHVERLLNIDEGGGRQSGPSSSRKLTRLDAAHAGPAAWHHPRVARAKAVRKRRRDASSTGPWLPALTWTVLGMGLMAFVCGGALLAWSAASGRQDLWSIGMPVGLGGQIVLLIGLILQLDRLWHDNRYTAEKLHRVDEQLHSLNTATTLLGTGPGSPSGAFYAHMASGAGPQLLLADLKSQLDLLAVRLGQEQG
jgi:hypothetical protein